MTTKKSPAKSVKKELTEEKRRYIKREMTEEQKALFEKNMGKACARIDKVFTDPKIQAIDQFQSILTDNIHVVCSVDRREIVRRFKSINKTEQKKILSVINSLKKLLSKEEQTEVVFPNVPNCKWPKFGLVARTKETMKFAFMWENESNYERITSFFNVYLAYLKSPETFDIYSGNVYDNIDLPIKFINANEKAKDNNWILIFK